MGELPSGPRSEPSPRSTPGLPEQKPTGPSPIESSQRELDQRITVGTLSSHPSEAVTQDLNRQAGVLGKEMGGAPSGSVEHTHTMDEAMATRKRLLAIQGLK